eukprot:JP448418.1.p1 GENE.JP448418.1~~JP448418.1.p1  ORF type:complete len:126 (+),score=37.68 JP448418.1:28-405(+)
MHSKYVEIYSEEDYNYLRARVVAADRDEIARVCMAFKNAFPTTEDEILLVLRDHQAINKLFAPLRSDPMLPLVSLQPKAMLMFENLEETCVHWNARLSKGNHVPSRAVRKILAESKRIHEMELVD